MAEYLRLLPTIVWILAVFGLVFSVAAGVARRLRGPRAVWVTWGAYCALVSVSVSTGSRRRFAGRPSRPDDSRASTMGPPRG